MESALSQLPPLPPCERCSKHDWRPPEVVTLPLTRYTVVRWLCECKQELRWSPP